LYAFSGAEEFIERKHGQPANDAMRMRKKKSKKKKKKLGGCCLFATHDTTRESAESARIITAPALLSRSGLQLALFSQTTGGELRRK